MDEKRCGTTTIQITRATRDRLRALGVKGETYDALVNRLLAGVNGDGEEAYGDDER